jgi:hypothetical protein
VTHKIIFLALNVATDNRTFYAKYHQYVKARLIFIEVILRMNALALVIEVWEFALRHYKI